MTRAEFSGSTVPVTNTTVSVSNTNPRAPQTPRVPKSRPDKGTSSSSTISEISVTPIVTVVRTKNMEMASWANTPSAARRTWPRRNNAPSISRVSIAAPRTKASRRLTSGGTLVAITSGAASNTIAIIAMMSLCTERAARAL